MFIGSALIEIDLPPHGTLKDKRRIVKSVLVRLRHEYNVAAAEVGAQDRHSVALIAVVTVSNEAGHTHGLLEKAVAFVAETRLDCEVAHYQIEIF